MLRLTLKITHNFVRRNGKVQIFWEGHKNLKKKSPYGLRLHSNVKKKMGDIFQIFLSFSEYLNFEFETCPTQDVRKKIRNKDEPFLQAHDMI